MFMRICSKCGKSYPAGERCECQKQRHKSYDRYERNKDSAEVYHSGLWGKLTLICKARCNGLDMYKLMMTGKPVVPHKGLCHHIIEIAEDASHAYDLDNLFYVGSDSHAIIHTIYKSGEGNKKALQKRMQTFLIAYLKGEG